MELIAAMCRANVHAALAAIAETGGREAEERCANMAHALGVSLSFAQGYGVFAPPSVLVPRAFAHSETTRCAAIAAAGIARKAAGSAEYAQRRGELRDLSAALASLAQRGATTADLDRARAERDMAERELIFAQLRL